MIKLVSIDKIRNHPENPRKDLGDLTELAESIKQSGILQNLTLVPIEKKEDEFYALIGNRRLAAAKLAGLTEVPCAIIEMDKKTQIGTMLLENMQRSDLTVYEQAQGFQMMLDLGETVTNISEKTGFSESTVRRRMKLLELDQEKLKESVQRGATLMDYVELEKIEDIELRNEVLEKIGTRDFDWELRSAIDKEKREKIFAEIIEQLDEFAEKADDHDNSLSYVKSYYNSPEVTKPKDADTVRYYYIVHSSWIGLYREKVATEEDIEEQEERRQKEEELKNRRIVLEETTKRAYELRFEFIKGLSNTKARKKMDAIIESTLYAIVESYFSLNYNEMGEIVGIGDKEDIEWEDISSQIWKQPELYLLTATYYMLDDPYKKYYSWDCTHQSNEELDYVYDFLKKLGYRMSEEEKQLQDGTHELFR